MALKSKGEKYDDVGGWAKRANVSKMTVSRVLNHPELVTEELKQLVQLAMKELDYQPNVVAKPLLNNGH